MEIKEQIEVLRAYVHGVGYTEGTKFEEATLTLKSGRDFDIYSMSEILDLMQHLIIQVYTGSPMSPTDKFVLQWLKANNIPQAFAALEAEVNKANNRGVGNIS